ncbi:MAG: hydroxymethylglutaryl-CoA synthase [Dehalococcoidales bacterium]|nr:hydroxymethylglutaryl-CoA synthase [Dehalococcoidales bacterium]
MAGITSIGVYIPIYRLNREEIGKVWGGRGGGGAKAVAGYDEDTVTMAVAAAIDCLNRGGNEADGLFLATTSAPYREKMSAGIVASAADFKDECQAADFTDSLRAGAAALKAACDAVKAGSAKNVMVVAADTRLGAAKGTFEQTLGDGAVAITVGKNSVIAEIENSYSLFSEFTDVWRTSEDKFPKSAEGRFVDDVGYLPIMQAVIEGLLKKAKLEIKDFSKIVYYANDVRQHAGLTRRLKLDKEKVQDPLFSDIGNTGAAAGLLMLAAALEKAKPNDRILYVGYGDGADAFALKVTDEIKKFQKSPVVSNKLTGKINITYGQYLTWRGMVPVEASTLPERSAISLQSRWRERKTILALYGVKCKKCGAPQMNQLGQNVRVCVQCQTKDQFEPYKFADKKAKLFTYSVDQLMPTLNPPGVNGVVDFEGGGRLIVEFTDCEIDKLKVDMVMEMTFRKMFDTKSIINYFWKAKPVE